MSTKLGEVQGYYRRKKPYDYLEDIVDNYLPELRGEELLDPSLQDT